jgi:DNA-binding PucR family transcriptional regulator
LAAAANRARPVLLLTSRATTTRVGVSPSFDDLAGTAKALRYARIALAARTTADEKVTVFDYSVLGVAAVSAPEMTARLADVILDGFDGLPRAEREVLFETFRVWADTGGSVAQTAVALVCHENTVRNRLRRIEECTGRSLTMPRELAELSLAFGVYRRNPD